MVVSAQLRAARAMMDWTIRDLAAVSGVHRNTITRLEADGNNGGHALSTLVRTFQDKGLIFIEEDEQGPGVRFQKPILAKPQLISRQ